MYLRFYGARGSIPTPMTTEEYGRKLRTILSEAAKTGADLSTEESREAFIQSLPFDLRATYGGNTSCVYLRVEDTHIILDMGSGLRTLGRELVATDLGHNSTVLHIFLSHLHWDHIQGLPFFIPAYLGGHCLHIYSPVERLASRMKQQQNAPFFPISLEKMGAQFVFHKLHVQKSYTIASCTVRTLELKHPNRSFAYRFEHEGKSLVYATDIELNEQSIDFIKTCTDFFHNADILIFDAQYTVKESFDKLHWGHSSVYTAIDIARKSAVKKLVLFHHEPGYNDAQLCEIHRDAFTYNTVVAQERALEVIPAYDGLKISL